MLSHLTGAQQRLDRTFIVLGGAHYGKSAVCNMLYGQGQIPLSIRTKFKCNTGSNPTITMTKCVQREVSYIEEGNITLRNDQIKNYLYFDIYDHCGIGDPLHCVEVLANHLIESYSKSQTSGSIVFLIVVSLIGCDFYEEYLAEMNLIINLIEERKACKVLDKAIIVFTHKDVYMNRLNIYKEQQLEDAFIADIQTPKWAELKDLLNQLENRKIFLNATDYSERNTFVGKVFNMSKPTLNILLYGNILFPATYFRSRISVEGIECNYKAKINIRIVDVFETSTDQNLLDQDSSGENFPIPRDFRDECYIFVILIDLFSLQQSSEDKNLEKLLQQLNDLYMSDWKSNTVLVFRIPNWYSSSNVTDGVEKNSLIKDIVVQTKKRYILETESMSGQVLANNFVDKCLEVKYDNNVWKSKSVVSTIKRNEMKKFIYDSITQHFTRIFNSSFRWKFSLSWLVVIYLLIRLFDAFMLHMN